MRVLITGATGLVGPSLISALTSDRHEVVVLSRSPDSARERLPGIAGAFRWDPMQGPAPAEAFDGVDGVVHLAGEPVAGRWTGAKRQAIHASREVGTANLVAGIAGLSSRPPVLVSASAIGFYGDRGDEELTEEAPRGGDFLADVCDAWERSAAAVEQHGVRSVRLRIGLVLDPAGGALGEMLPMAKLGIAGPLGSGRQWWSWIHRDDLVSLMLAALQDEAYRGAINAVGPRPARQGDFARAVGRVLGRPAFLPAPAFALKLVLGGFATEVLTSKKVICSRAEALGFGFRFPELEPALRDLL